MRSLDRKRAAGVPAAHRQRSTDAAAGDHDLVMESGPFGNDASGQRRIRHSERADARIAQHDRAVPAAEFDRNARENQTERDLDPSRLRRPTISALRMLTPNGVTAAGGIARDGTGVGNMRSRSRSASRQVLPMSIVSLERPPPKADRWQVPLPQCRGQQAIRYRPRRRHAMPYSWSILAIVIRAQSAHKVTRWPKICHTSMLAQSAPIAPAKLFAYWDRTADWGRRAESMGVTATGPRAFVPSSQTGRDFVRRRMS